MIYHASKPYNEKESEIMSESAYFSPGRRKLLKSGILSLLASSSYLSSLFSATEILEFKPNSKYGKIKDEKITKENLFTKYNNFYEFSFDKSRVHIIAKDFKTTPWKIEISGLVDHPITLDVKDLVKLFPIEERIYRLRCVEKWSAVVPWEGFPLRKLIEKVSPKSSAKFVKFTSFYRPEKAPGQLLDSYPWPYTEGLRMDEAMHDLTLVSVGAYGKPLKNQNGAPIRIVTPWKYGYKSIKSIEKIEFVDKQPPAFWNKISSKEYGFYSNVNPEVSHPRWSQRFEKPLGSFFSSNPTLKFNGYNEVASLYKGMDLKKFH